MQLLANMTRQTGDLLRAQPLARKLVLLAMVLASVAAMMFLVIRAQTGGYAVLYSGLERGDIGEIARALDRKGIPYRSENAGETIKVARNRVDEAHLALAMEGLPSSGTPGFDMLDRPTIGQSNFVQQKNYHRMLEGEIVRSLTNFENIEQARVHIALPEDSPFIRDQREATVSVQVKLRRGTQLNERQISGITHFVSLAIKGVDPSHIAIVDQQGNMLNQAREDSLAQNSAAQAQYKLAYEERLKREVESLIENTIGRGRVAARVQADFDFSSLREESQIYNPEDQEPIPTMEQSTLEQRTAVGEVLRPAGSASNVPGLDKGGAPVAEGGNLRQDSTRQFAVSQQRRETTLNVPQLKRLTVAVLVDGKHTVEGGQTTFETLSQPELTNIENLVRATVGFSDDRGDMVMVQCSPFTVAAFEDTLDSGWLDPNMRRLFEHGLQWFVIGLIGLLLITTVIRPAIKQILVVPAQAQALPGVHIALPRQAGEQAGSEHHSAGASGSHAGEAAGGAMLAERLLGNSEQTRMFQMQQMAAEQARTSQAQAQQIHKEVLETAKTQPQKTVSLLRQWMDEA